MTSKNPLTPATEPNKVSAVSASKSTPNFLRKRVVSKSLLSSNTGQFVDEIIKKGGCGNVLDTAFVQSPMSGLKTTVSNARNISNSSVALNACYTPSSLYRRAATSSSSTPHNLKMKLSTTKSTQKKFLNEDVHSTPECFAKVSLETTRHSAKSTNATGIEEFGVCKEGEISNLSVAVRVRPMNVKECLRDTVTNIVQVKKSEVVVLAGTSADNSAGVSHRFQYDHAFWSCNPDDPYYADQEEVFKKTALPMVKNAFEGYNACLFAYGQTGSGKSYSMMGIEGDDEIIGAQSEAGIIPRFCQELFRKIESVRHKVHAEIEVSYFEIYNEKIHDLLSVSQIEANNLCSNTKKNALRVREHPVWGPYVVDLSTQPVESYVSLRNWLAVGNSQRATASTGMNEKSSRSHSIFNIVLNLTENENAHRQGTQNTKRSKISLVDLAGSERISNTCTSGERLREGVSINKSLLTLGKVIAALADTKKGGAFVPYRESVLTWLLRESLGGNSRTVMLATISPASLHLDETLATLRYACQARTIVNRVKVNEDPHDKIIRELRAEVERLQALHQDYERQKRHSTSASNAPARKIIIETSVDECEVEALRVQLVETERELAKAQKSWMQRLEEAEELRKSEMQMLRRKGLALELSADQKQACLVNLAEDPILSGILFYILPPGTVQVGRSRPSSCSMQPDIVLDGPLVGFNHCTIENLCGKLYLTPNNMDFETYVNGELIVQKREIFHGDRLVIGGSHYFRISNPHCTNRNTSSRTIDYQLAHQEILQKQEKKLRLELQQEKELALKKIEEERAINEKEYKEKLAVLELETFKNTCSQELLEAENRAIKENPNSDEFQYTPYKSTLLEEMKELMQTPSKDSLHQTQLMVKEASQRCRDVGLAFDFRQTQIMDEFGIFRTAVDIVDKKSRRKAECPPARIDAWLNMLRENEIDPEAPFATVDIDWHPFNESLNESLNDSLNSSKISLNLSSIKDAFHRKKLNVFKARPANNHKENSRNNLNKSSQLRNFEISKKLLTYDHEDTICFSAGSDFNASAKSCLKDIQRARLKLKELCDTTNLANENAVAKSTVRHIYKSVDQLENIISDLTEILMNESCKATETTTSKAVRFFLD